LLQVWRGGDRSALDALLPLVYKELRRRAHFQLRNERPNHTLQSAALVHGRTFAWSGERSSVGEPHSFLCHCRPAHAPDSCRLCPPPWRSERGGSVCKLSLEEATMMSRRKDVMSSPSMRRLNHLAKMDPRQSRVVRICASLPGSPWSRFLRYWKLLRLRMQRDWTAARAWLQSGDLQEFPCMSTERWERTKQILEEALRIAPGRRQAYLDLVCGPDSELGAEVESLIASHEEAGSAFLAAAAPELLELTSSTRPPNYHEPRHRHYRLVEEAGRGGMGWCTRPRIPVCTAWWH